MHFNRSDYVSVLRCWFVVCCFVVLFVCCWIGWLFLFGVLGGVVDLFWLFWFVVLFVVGVFIVVWFLFGCLDCLCWIVGGGFVFVFVCLATFWGGWAGWFCLFVLGLGLNWVCLF